MVKVSRLFRIRAFKLVPAAFVGLLAFQAAHADNIFVAPFQTAGSVDADKANVVQMLFKNELGAKGYTAVDKESGAKTALHGTLTKLDQNYVVSVSLTDGRSRQLKTKNFDEIDVAVKRLVYALVNNVEIEASAAQGEVVSRDSSARETVKAQRGWMLGFGAGWPVNYAKTDYLWAFNVGYAWGLREMFLELRYDLATAFGDGARGFQSFTLGTQWFVHDWRQSSVFAGGEFGFAGAYGDGSARGGFDFSGDIGVLFLRHADINFETRFRYSILAAKLNNRVPMCASLMLGVHF